MITSTKNHPKKEIKADRQNYRTNGKEQSCTDKITQRSIHIHTHKKRKKKKKKIYIYKNQKKRKRATKSVNKPTSVNKL